MKFYKDSILIKILARAESYNSGLEAYGELFIPFEIYERNKEDLEDISVVVFGLDDEYSETDCDIEFQEYVLMDVLNTDFESCKSGKDLEDKIYEEVCCILDLTRDEEALLHEFNAQLLELDKYCEDDWSFECKAVGNLI